MGKSLNKGFSLIELLTVIGVVVLVGGVVTVKYIDLREDAQSSLTSSQEAWERYNCMEGDNDQRDECLCNKGLAELVGRNPNNCVECAPGKEKNTQGQCDYQVQSSRACPYGQWLDDGVCEPCGYQEIVECDFPPCPRSQYFYTDSQSCRCPPHSSFDSDQNLCVCEDGRVDTHGSLETTVCSCPPGKRERYGVCVDITCTGGRIIREGRYCGCPDGQVVGLSDRCEHRTTNRCFGGDIENNQCVCPAGKVLSRETCVIPDTSPPPPTCPGNKRWIDGVCKCPAYKITKANDVCESCISGSVVNNRCVCPSTHYNITEYFCSLCSHGKIQDPNNSYQCINSPNSCPGNKQRINGVCSCIDGAIETEHDVCITCSFGSVINNRCVCPNDRYNTTEHYCGICPPGEVQDPDDSTRCIYSSTTCTGGKIRQGSSCVCPAGKVENSDGVCETQITICRGGSIENNQCVCPTGKEERPTGYCATIRLICTGGQTEQNGACACPSGKELQGGICVTAIPKCTTNKNECTKGIVGAITGENHSSRCPEFNSFTYGCWRSCSNPAFNRSTGCQVVKRGGRWYNIVDVSDIGLDEYCFLDNHHAHQQEIDYDTTDKIVGFVCKQ